MFGCYSIIIACRYPPQQGLQAVLRDCQLSKKEDVKTVDKLCLEVILLIQSVKCCVIRPTGVLHS